MLPILVREADTERLDLRRLDLAAIQLKIAGRYDLSGAELQQLAEYLARHSDGNPLFLVELLRTLEIEQLLRHDGERWTLIQPRDSVVPPLLHQVIDRRLGRLRPATRDALAIAAIIGYEVPVTIWGTVSSLPDEQLADVVDEAITSHVSEELPGGAGLRFSHALVREAMYEPLALPRRRIWHRSVAEALISVPSTSPDEVAYHSLQAGDHSAVEWLVRRWAACAASKRLITAAERLTTAADLLEDDDTRVQERGWLHFYAAYLLRFSGNLWSFQVLDATEQTARAIGDPVLAAYRCYTRGSTTLHARRHPARTIGYTARCGSRLMYCSKRSPSHLSIFMRAPSSDGCFHPMVPGAVLTKH